MNAIGNTLPPVFVFPRVHFKVNMLKCAPAQSLGLACASGWMNGELFPKALAHFMKFMNVNKSQPGLLLMDNHISHLSIEAVDLARENGLHLLTFPPHCSHRLQPLDVGVYGPFKRYYSSLCNSWMTSNPGKPITIYDVAELSGTAYQKSFTYGNIASSFKATGIYPYNRDIFSEDLFLPAVVSDRPAPLEQEDQHCAPLASALASSSSNLGKIGEEGVLLSIAPYPKADINRQRTKKNKLSTAIISDSPEKRKILLRRNKTLSKILPAKMKNAQKIESSESNSEEDSDMSEAEDTLVTYDKESENFSVEVSDFAVIKVFSSASSYKNFVGQILDGPDEDGDYEVRFLRRSQKMNDGFVFPDITDAASIKADDVVRMLPKPSAVAATKRLRGIIGLSVNLEPYGI